MRSITPWKISLLIAALGLAACGGDGGGTEPAPPAQPGAIRGTVSVGATGQAGVQVALAGGGTQTTSASGQYTFGNLAVGNYSLTVTPPQGFGLASGHTSTKSATVRSGQTETVDWLLEQQGGGGQVREIRMSGTQFAPNAVTISVGTTVRWVNDGGQHTVTPDNPNQAGVWTGTGLLGPGQTFQYTFTTVGTYPYHCIPHQAAGMTGTIVVQ